MLVTQNATGGAEFIPTRLGLLNRLKRLDDQGSWREFFDTYWRFLYVLKGWLVGEVVRTVKANVPQVYLAKHRVTSMIKKETEKLRKRMET